MACFSHKESASKLDTTKPITIYPLEPHSYGTSEPPTSYVPVTLGSLSILSSFQIITCSYPLLINKQKSWKSSQFHFNMRGEILFIWTVFFLFLKLSTFWFLNFFPFLFGYLILHLFAISFRYLFLMLAYRSLGVVREIYQRSVNTWFCKNKLRFGQIFNLISLIISQMDLYNQGKSLCFFFNFSHPTFYYLIHSH
jgi:hypothetical protein